LDNETIPVIAIDGPGGSGKGTIALCLARHLGWNILDSGELYRLVAVAAMDRGVSVDHVSELGTIARELDASFTQRNGEKLTLLDGQIVTQRLRSEDVGAFASRVAVVSGVRSALVERQRAFREPPGLVADGRDMGTVIFPDAKLKIFLTASAEERARRRYKQLKDKGENVTLSRLFREIKKRDERDQSRLIAPLRPAKDAHVVDSTELGIDEVLQIIINLLD
jgi:cytidylate kinase